MKSKLYQVSTMKALMMGDYFGAITVKEVLMKADVGLGTYEDLDGEAIIYKGKAYSFKADGKNYPANLSDKLAFFSGAKMDIRAKKDAITFNTYAQLKKQLLSHIDKNYFYLIILDGRFTLKTRTCPKQKTPYKPLYQVADEQVTFDYQDVDGTVLGFYCPEYFDGINLKGFHFHFLSSDLNKGGHILKIASKKATFRISKLNNYQLRLPQDNLFNKMNLMKDLTDETKKTEG